LPNVRAVRLKKGGNYSSLFQPIVVAWHGKKFASTKVSPLPAGSYDFLSHAGWVLTEAADGGAAVTPGVEPMIVGKVYRSKSGDLFIDSNRLTVRYRDDLDEEQVQNSLASDGLSIVRQLRMAPHLYEVEVSGDQDALDVASRLSKDDRFLYAEPQLIGQIGPRRAQDS